MEIYYENYQKLVVIAKDLADLIPETNAAVTHELHMHSNQVFQHLGDDSHREILYSQIFDRLSSIPENDGRMHLLNSTNFISLKRITLPTTNLHRYKEHMR